jgi:hypothetical protein
MMTQTIAPESTHMMMDHLLILTVSTQMIVDQSRARLLLVVVHMMMLRTSPPRVGVRLIQVTMDMGTDPHLILTEVIRMIGKYPRAMIVLSLIMLKLLLLRTMTRIIVVETMDMVVDLLTRLIELIQVPINHKPINS